ncbi:MAG TPA: glycosyltransferase, partial [Paracoccaceae bacterium]|nr:glycosyltransferase [Paracoccaceae bacterium]
MPEQSAIDPRKFNPSFYLSQYPEVAASGIDPIKHYNTRGWKEGKDPSPYFSTEYYLESYPDIREAGINPFEHFVNHGYSEGRITGLSKSHRSEMTRRVERLLLHESDDTVRAQVEEPGAEGDVALLFASRFFSAGHYARASGAKGDRAALIRHYLARPPAARPSPSPDFCAGFYRATYLAPGDRGADALLAFLRSGLAQGRYPNGLLARRDIELIRASRSFDERTYRRSIGRKLRHDDPIEDYVLGGQHANALPRLGFEGAFVRSVYMAPKCALGAPYAYFLRHRERPWIFGGLDELCPVYEEVAASPLFDAGFYARAARLDPAEIDAVLHYVLRGVQAGQPTSPDFHTALYLARYPDLRRARLNPLLHFERHGRSEGRQAVPGARIPARSRLVIPGLAPRRAGAATAIVVSHEAGLTGAPIVALNIARALSRSHDVITWLGKPGTLSEEFRAASTDLVTAFPPTLDAADLLADLKRARQIDFAIVNSALSGVTIEALRLAGIPVILLVHDFANYVYPRGTLARLALNAQIAVFPARIVAAALEDELNLLGIDRVPDNLRIAHQGHNGADRAKRATLTAQAILEQIGAGSSRGEVRILFGGGWVQPRKGVDLFLQAAARLARDGRHDWRFIWVGGNYKPNEDMIVSAYLADHVVKAGLTGRMFFFDEQPDLESFWAIADVFFLSSRLDPFPNIALDALMRDVPVVCFEGATGIADLTEPFGFAVKAAPFGDPGEAARLIDALAAKRENVRAEFRKARARLETAFSFQTYVGRLVGFAAEAKARAEAQAALCRQLAARPLDEIARAAAGLPDWARLGPSSDRQVSELSLAAMLTCGGPVAPLELAEGAPIERAAPAGPNVRICRPLAGEAAAPGTWSIHLHVSGPAALETFLGEARLPWEVPAVVSSPTGDRFANLLAPGMTALEAPCDDPFGGLAAALAQGGAALVTHLDLSTAEPAQIAALLEPGFVATARADAAASGPFACAIAERGYPLRPRRAVERYRSFAADPPSGPIPPGFAGLFDAAILAGFLAESRTEFRRRRIGLTPLEAATLRALMFAAHCAAAGHTTLICPDFEAGAGETADLCLRRGIPEEAGEPLPDRILVPVPSFNGELPVSGRHRAARSTFSRLWRGIA